MNDIEILESFIKQLEEFEDEEELKQAIENLINRVKDLEKIVEAYNVIPNDYIPKDMKIVIADREYFANGILKETCLPISKIKEKIEELKNRPNKMVIDKGIPQEYKNIFLDENAINVLQELLEEDKNEYTYKEIVDYGKNKYFDNIH